jgi:hypothetical protein
MIDQAPIQGVADQIGTKGSAPFEPVSSKNLDDLKHFWFAGHYGIPVGVVVEVSRVDGNSIAVLTNAVGNERSCSRVLASSTVHRPKLGDMRA